MDFETISMLSSMTTIVGLAVGFGLSNRSSLATNSVKSKVEKGFRRVTKDHVETNYPVVVAREERIRNKYFSYINNIGLSLKYPLMRDTTNDLIVALNTAMTEARGLREHYVDSEVKDIYTTPYGRAVREFESKFLKAEAVAHKMKETFMSPSEQKSVVMARDLLSIVVDVKASLNERQLAYRKVLKIMDDLSMPATQKSSQALESSSGVRLEVEK